MMRKLTLSLFTVLFVLLLGEGFCRALWSVGDLQLSPENAHLRDHPTRLWVQAQNLDIELPEHGRLQTNELGFRDGPVVLPKPRNQHRILSLGESSTWGHGVRAEETYSAVLQRILKRSGASVRVINAGIPAYTVQQSAIFLEEEAARLQPDVILVYHQTNDFLPAHAVDTHNPLVRLTGNDREIIDRRRPLAPLLRALFHSRLYLAVRNAMLRLPTSLPQADAVTDGPVRVPTQDRVAALNSMLQTANSIGARLVIVQPMYAIDHTQDSLLRDWAAENQQTYVETGSMRTSILPQIQRLYLPDGVHPRPRVHRMIAEKIAASLR
jgi:lysophospholipase L1-like esterase